MKLLTKSMKIQDKTELMNKTDFKTEKKVKYLGDKSELYAISK